MLQITEKDWKLFIKYRCLSSAMYTKATGGIRSPSHTLKVLSLELIHEAILLYVIC